mgnify:CR=1 FL=1
MKLSVFEVSPKTLAIVVTAVVIASIGYGVFLAEPWQSRAINTDIQRIDDLDEIDRSIKEYWRVKGELPVTLDDLDKGDYFVSEEQRTDPDGLRYGYTRLESKSYELCSEFYLDSDESIMEDWRGDEWDHPRGYHCFQFDDLDPFIGSSTIR